MKSNINFSYLIFLSVVAALGGFLFGYDAAVISGTISQVTVKFGLDEIQIGWFVGWLVGHIAFSFLAGCYTPLHFSHGKDGLHVLRSVIHLVAYFGVSQRSVLPHLVTLWNNWCLHVCWEV